VLARAQQGLDHLTVHRVGDRDADHVDVGGVHDRLPRRLGALVAEALGRVDGEGLVGISDGDEAGVGSVGVEQAPGGAVAGGVRTSDHADADDGDTDGVLSHVCSSGVRGGRVCQE